MYSHFNSRETVSQGLPQGGQWKCMEVDGLSNVSLKEGLWFTGDFDILIWPLSIL